MLRNSVLQNVESHKFHLPYCGPYHVVEVLPPVNYVIESLDGSTTKRVHFKRLKKSGGRINEKSTVEDEKLKNHPVMIGQIATWDFVDVSPQVGRTCHEVTILIVVDQIYELQQKRQRKKMFDDFIPTEMLSIAAGKRKSNNTESAGVAAKLLKKEEDEDILDSKYKIAVNDNNVQCSTPV